MNRDGCVNSPRAIVRVKAYDECKPIAQWLAQSSYSIDDNCDGDSDDDDSDNIIITLGTQSLKTWKLVYRWQVDLI